MHFFFQKPSLNYTNFKRPAKCHIFPPSVTYKIFVHFSETVRSPYPRSYQPIGVHRPNRPPGISFFIKSAPLINMVPNRSSD